MTNELENPMKRQFSKPVALAGMVLMLGISSAEAKDWIQKVRISNGIDPISIDVLSDGNQYTVTTKSTHDFRLDLYARAKSGKQIFYGRVNSGDQVSIFESIPNSQFSMAFKDGFVNHGTKRTWSTSATLRINLGTIFWDQINPQQACNAVLTRKMSQGQPKVAVLSQVQETEVQAVFRLSAAAAKPAYAESHSFPDHKDNVGLLGPNISWTEESAGMRYPVRVRCLPSSDPENKLQQPQPKPATLADKPKRNGDKLIKALPVIIGVGIALSGRGSGGVPGR
jgi:hypothetical protein